jgi:type IV secretion system protein VirB11
MFTSPSQARALTEYLEPLAPFMADSGNTEIAVNRPNEVWTESREGWKCHPVDLSAKHCKYLGDLIASYNMDSINENKPVVSGILPTQERVQVVQAPACTQGTVSLTIRKFNDLELSLEELNDQGAFSDVRKARQGISPIEEMLLQLHNEQRYYEFIKLAVKHHLNIIIGGATGSGKTVLNKSMIQLINPAERIITIEDVHELFMRNFPNKVHLFYKNKVGSNFTSRDALASCVRMKPDRILLSELRGPETLDYIESLNTGHPGSITSIHANSAWDVFSRLTSLIKKSEAGLTLDTDFIRSMCYQTIDVVLFYKNRKLVEVYYEPERKYAA